MFEGASSTQKEVYNMFNPNELIEKTQIVSIDVAPLGDLPVEATYSFNLSGSGYIKGEKYELFFFRLSCAGVYAEYTFCHLERNDIHYDPDVYMLQSFRYKTNGKRGGLGKNQEELASALWHPLHLMMERELRSRDWRWVGLNSRHHNHDMYQVPSARDVNIFDDANEYHSASRGC